MDNLGVIMRKYQAKQNWSTFYKVDHNPQNSKVSKVQEMELFQIEGD